jgi:DNA-binding NarL/FixJ family response regulator
MKQPRVLIADDHALLLEAFRKLLEPECEVVGAVENGRALVEDAVRLRPEVIVADISMPRLNGLDACTLLRRKVPEARLIFLTVNEDPDIAEEAIRRGASGFILKKSASSELFEAIRQALAGRHYVTPLICKEPVGVFVARAKACAPNHGLSARQREVLQLLAEGRSMKEAADILGVVPRTVAFHKYTMIEQLGLKTGAELVQHAVRMGLVAGKSPL